MNSLWSVVRYQQDSPLGDNQSVSAASDTKGCTVLEGDTLMLGNIVLQVLHIGLQNSPVSASASASVSAAAFVEGEGSFTKVMVE